MVERNYYNSFYFFIFIIILASLIAVIFGALEIVRLRA